MDLAELEAKHAKSTEDEFVGDNGGEELLIRQDIVDAISLLEKVKRLLDYVSDTNLCKSVTKRERETMTRIAEQVSEYLDEVATNYEETE